MKQKIIFIIALLLIISVLIFASIYIDRKTRSYLSSKGNDNSGEVAQNQIVPKPENSIETTNAIEAEPVNNPYEKSIVTKINAQEFDELVTNSSDKVLVDFFATWCGPCELLSPILEEVASEKSNIKYYRVDIDEEENLANHHRIMYLPTLVLFESGEELNRSIGLVDKEALSNFIDNPTASGNNF